MPEEPVATSQSGRSSLFTDRNCWRTGRAHRFGWLIDGEEYFLALRHSLEAATREILIVGWDIDSGVSLVRDESHPWYPSPLAETLQSLVERRPHLEVRVLSWDFAMLYVLERELLPAYRFGWENSERLDFCLDGNHATGASHHQKFVVIDGELAFIGGFDLTRNRWDTRRHAVNEPGRVNTSGDRYRPFHDVQAVVSGEPANQLRELAVFRWRNATGGGLPDLEDIAADAGESAWPGDVPVRGSNVATCLARTWGAHDGQETIKEVERLYEDLIFAARDSIYIENQYFTSIAITNALCERLAEANGPEIAVVLPAESSGWLEQVTMDVLRSTALNRLRAADRNKRLEIFAPVSSELDATSINVHDKVMIVDDRWTRIGSANLSGRSMGLDSECDIAVEDPAGKVAPALRADLLGEHLSAEPDVVAESIRNSGLLSAIRRHSGAGRSLERLDIAAATYEEMLEPLVRIADLERPVEASWGVLAAARHDPAGDERGKTGILRVLTSPAAGWTFLAAVFLLAVFWAVWTAQRGDEGLDPAVLLDLLRVGAKHPLAPVAVVLAFVAGSMVMAPVTGMIGLCALLFSPWVASASSIAGTLAATFVNYEIGLHLGKFVEKRGPRALVDRMRSVGRSADAWSLAGLRLIPIAPFTVFNVLAGALHVPLRAVLTGTLLGMGPGVVLICFSVDRARAALRGEPLFEPWIIGVIVLAGAAMVGMRVWQKRRGH